MLTVQVLPSSTARRSQPSISNHPSRGPAASGWPCFSRFPFRALGLFSHAEAPRARNRQARADVVRSVPAGRPPLQPASPACVGSVGDSSPSELARRPLPRPPFRTAHVGCERLTQAIIHGLPCNIERCAARPSRQPSSADGRAQQARLRSTTGRRTPCPMGRSTHTHA